MDMNYGSSKDDGIDGARRQPQDLPEPTPGGRGQTTERREREQEPRLPHEHDESADSQGGDPTNGPASVRRRVIRQAQLDIEEGRVDTDRGPPMEEVYDRELRSESLGEAVEPALDAAAGSREDGQVRRARRSSVR
jgi:hypothetical protein